jgi:O-antigen ligase
LIYHSIKFDQSSIEKSIRTNLNSNIIFNRSKHESVDNFTTGRFTIWKDLLSSKKNFKQITFGFGTQADRVLTAPAYFSASNSYVYIFISSGIIGLIIILSFIIFLIYRITKLIFVNKIFSKNGNILLKFSILLFTYLLIRSLVESSFAVYGIDYLFFILSSKIIILSTTR